LKIRVIFSSSELLNRDENPSINSSLESVAPSSPRKLLARNDAKSLSEIRTGTQQYYKKSLKCKSVTDVKIAIDKPEEFL
jgi:hypothetical protein